MEVKNTLLIAQNELKNLVFTKKVLFMIIIYVGLFFISIKAASFLEMISYLIPKFRQPLPYNIVLPFYSSILILPLLCLLTIYDTIAYEFDKKTLKYLVYRTSRNSILVGKLFAPFVLILCINFSLYAVLYIYNFTARFSDYINEIFFMFIFSMIITLLFLGVGMLFSIIEKNARKALWAGLIFNIIFFVVSFIDNKIIKFISVFEFAKGALLTIKEGVGSLPIIIVFFVVYVIVLLVIDATIFKRKDIY